MGKILREVKAKFKKQGLKIQPKFKKIAAISSVALIAVSFALTAFLGINSEESTQAAYDSTPKQIRAIDASELVVSNVLTPQPADIAAFDAKRGTDPIVISNQSELLGFAYYVNSGEDFAGQNIKLGADIDLGGTKPTYSRNSVDANSDDYTVTGTVENVWTPIGSASTKFRGNFDGGGYTISNMTAISDMTGEIATIELATAADYTALNAAVTAAGGADIYYRDNYGYAESYAGLFGYVENGSIKNLTMENPTAIAQEYAYVTINRNYLTPPAPLKQYYGGYAQAGAVVGKINGELSEITVTDAAIFSGSKDSFAGGVAGSSNLDNTNTISIIGSSVSGDSLIVAGGYSGDTTNVHGQAGGIVGGLGKLTDNVAATVTIEDVSFTGGTVLANEIVGGIAASFWVEDKKAFSGSANVTFDTATVEIEGLEVGTQGGGIIGSIAGKNVNFINCNVTSTKGFIGTLGTTLSSVNASGLSGAVMVSSGGNLTVSSSSATGDVQTQAAAGGLFGSVWAFAYGSYSSYFDLTISNSSYSGSVTATSGSAGGFTSLMKNVRYVFVDGFTVTGNVSSSTQTGGLFGGFESASSLTLKNINIDGDITSNSSQAGGLFGGGSNSGAVTIENVTVEGNVSGKTQVGGLYGAYGNNSSGGVLSVKTSSVTGDVTGGNNVGGLAGAILATVVTIDGFDYTAATETGISSVSGGGAASGIAPYFYIKASGASNTSTFNNIHLKGNISSGSGEVAGIGSGYFSHNIALTNSSFEGNLSINGGYEAGGAFGGMAINGDLTISGFTRKGNLTAGSATLVGGLIGAAGNQLQKLTVEDSSVTGDITITANANGVAGIVGGYYSYSDTIIDNVQVDGDISNKGSFAGGFASIFKTKSLSITDSTFDGNLTANGHSAGGLFVSAVMEGQMTLDNVTQKGDITAPISAAKIAPHFQLGGASTITITDSNFTDGDLSTNANEPSGGLFGTFYISQSMTIDNVKYKGDLILPENSTGGAGIGKLVAFANIGGDLTVTNSEFLGEVYAPKAPDAGGLAGAMQVLGETTLKNLTVEGDVTGLVRTGGLFGILNSYSGNGITVDEITMTGDIKNSSVDMDENSINMSSSMPAYGGSRAGGLFGEIANYMGKAGVTISNVEQNGDVTGLVFSGGLMGNIGGVYGDLTVSDSNFTGDVKATYSKRFSASIGHAGGIIGAGDSGTHGIIISGGGPTVYDISFRTITHRGNVEGALAGGIIAGVDRADLYQTAQIGDVTGLTYGAGGLVGAAVILNIDQSLANGNISTDAITANGFIATYVGGLVGGNSGWGSGCDGQTCPVSSSPDYTINNSWYAGNVNVNAIVAAFAGGLVGGSTDSTGSSMGKINIDNSYMVGNTDASNTSGAPYVYSGNVVGYSINDPTISESGQVYVDYQELSDGRCAIANQGSCVATPSIGDDSYHAGVTNLKTWEMTGDGKGLPGYNAGTVIYKDEDYSLTEDRAVDNMVFVEDSNDIWRVPAEQLGSKIGSVARKTMVKDESTNALSFLGLGSTNAYAKTITDLYDMDTYYPRLAWIDIGPNIKPAVEILSGEPDPEPGKGGDIPGVPGTSILAAISGFGAIALAAIAFLIIKRRRAAFDEDFDEE
jgi:hypothetical protein